MGFIDWMRGVISRMFGYTQLKAIAGCDITMTQRMIDAINLWHDMVTGCAGWVNSDRGVRSLKIEAGICREFTDIVLGEMEAYIDNDALDEVFQAALSDLGENLQDGLALGSFIMKPLDGGRSEFVTADKFVPIAFDDNGKPKDVMFFTVKRVGESNYFTKVERHRFDENHDLVIENTCFHSTSASHIGNRCPLTSVPEWADISPEPVTYPGMKQNDYGYFRTPLKNRIDGSPCGVSIYAEAAEAIRDADVQYGRLDWEYSSGERAVHVDERALMRKNGRIKLPAGKQRLYRGLNIEQNGGELYKEYSPEMRDEAYIRGLEKCFRNIEYIVGLSYGDLSDASDVDKTATEIKASKARKYNRVSAIQGKLKTCLEDFVDALAFYNDMYNSNYTLSCVFNDSILIDDETERDQDRKDVAMGVMGLAEYRAKWYQEDIEEAASKLPEQTSGVIQ